MSEAQTPPWESAFIRRMKKIREERGISQADLAKQVAAEGLAFHQPTIQRIESGSRPVRLNEATAIAGALREKLEDMIRPETVEFSGQALEAASRKVGLAAWNYGLPPLDNLRQLRKLADTARQSRERYIEVCRSSGVEPDESLLRWNSDSESVGVQTMQLLLERASDWIDMAARFPHRVDFDADIGYDVTADYWDGLQSEFGPASDA